MLKAICIVCLETYREECDDESELMQTHGICNKCLEEIKEEKKKKKEVELK